MTIGGIKKITHLTTCMFNSCFYIGSLMAYHCFAKVKKWQRFIQKMCALFSRIKFKIYLSFVTLHTYKGLEMQMKKYIT
jgi:hypothetical protein